MSATAEHYNDQYRLNSTEPLTEAVGHLNDISVALHSISYELEQIRLALTVESTSEPAYTPIHTAWGQMTCAEWTHGEHR
jgi:hypothetical protein